MQTTVVTAGEEMHKQKEREGEKRITYDCNTIIINVGRLMQLFFYLSMLPGGPRGKKVSQKPEAKRSLKAALKVG
jgi:hypothetical protein